MGKPYKSYVPEQDWLLPPSLRHWLPDEHLAFFVSDLVDELDLSAITAMYEREDRGQPPYHPAMMTKVLLYGYCIGVFSSRKVARRLVEDVAFRVLAVANLPDFRTVSTGLKGDQIRRNNWEPSLLCANHTRLATQLTEQVKRFGLRRSLKLKTYD